MTAQFMFRFADGAQFTLSAANETEAMFDAKDYAGEEWFSLVSGAKWRNPNAPMEGPVSKATEQRRATRERRARVVAAWAAAQTTASDAPKAGEGQSEG